MAQIEHSDTLDTGATVVITHKVAHHNTTQYEAWLNAIRTKVQNAQGFLDSQVIRPVLGLTETYTVILRFDTIAHLHDWIHSDTRNELIAQVSPILINDDEFRVSSGLEFLFADPTPTVTPPKVPRRWKQFLVTWSAIFPLVTVMTWLVMTALSALHLDLPRLLVTLIVTGLVVYSMVYIVMPRYTKLVHHWLTA